MRECKKCYTLKKLEEFPKHPECADGRKFVCKDCVYARQKVQVRESGNSAHRKYAMTEKGFLVRTYSNMLGRVNGLVKSKRHLYFGLEILSREDFYNWSLNNPDFKKLIDVYRESGYDRKLAPSIDRIDSSKGYILGNIRWLTHSENSSIGSKNRHKGGK